MAHRPARYVVAALATALLLLSARRASAEGEVLRDAWQIVKIGGERAGWEHTVITRLAGSPARISSAVESRTSTLAMGQKRETVTVETTVEAEDGALVSIHAVEKQSAEETTTDIAFEGKKARVTTTTMGTKRDTVVDMADGVVGPWRAEGIAKEAGYPAGKTFDFKTFQRQLGGVVMVHVGIRGIEEIEIEKGKKVSAIRLDQMIEGLPFKIAAWVEKDGSTIRSQMQVSGMLIESTRATKEEALAEPDPKTATPDMFAKTMIVVEELFAHARTAESARVRIRPRQAGTTIPELADERQTVEAHEPDGSIVVSMKRVVPPAGATGPLPVKDPPADVLPFLAASSSIQSDDPLLKQKSGEAVAGETDAWKAAQAIEKWVSKNLTKKNMGVGFASALEVCKNREGDCTEHSVLVAGLCRAAGIPARVVMGLECIQGIWGGHAWDEVWIGGHWYALDATLGYGSVDPFHLAVAKTALAEGSFGKELLSLMSVVGAVDVSVLEVTWKGRTMKPSDPTQVRLRYDNRNFDLSFAAPPGFDMEPVRPAGLSTRLVTASGKAADGSKAKLTVGTFDAPADFELLGATVKVDGRPATLEDKDGRRRVIVLREDTVFMFEMKPATSEADRKTFDEFLATVDLDPVASTGR